MGDPARMRWDFSAKSDLLKFVVDLLNDSESTTTTGAIFDEHAHYSALDEK